MEFLFHFVIESKTGEELQRTTQVVYSYEAGRMASNFIFQKLFCGS